jgi:hypothetical protein
LYDTKYAYEYLRLKALLFLAQGEGAFSAVTLGNLTPQYSFHHINPASAVSAVYRKRIFLKIKSARLQRLAYLIQLAGGYFVHFSQGYSANAPSPWARKSKAFGLISLLNIQYFGGCVYRIIFF